MTGALALVPEPDDRVMLHAVLPSVLTDDRDEQLVTDTLLDRADLSGELAELVDALADLLEHATAAATRTAYQSDLGHFTTWAADYQLATLPAAPRTVALYITAHEDTLRPSTLLRRLSSITVAHRSAGHRSPCGHELVRRAVQALRRKHVSRPAAKSALVTAQLQVICTTSSAQLHPP